LCESVFLVEHQKRRSVIVLMNNLKNIGLFLLVLTLTACVNIVHYERPEHTLRPLQTTLKRIVLHEDFISSDSDSLGLKKYFFKALAKRLSAIKGNEIIVIKSGAPFPKLLDNKGSLLIIGDIWSNRTKQTGRNVQLKTLTNSSANSSSSRDVLEHLHWEQESVMSYTNLYFIELTENPQLLRSTITASNYTAVNVIGDKGTKQAKIMTQVEFQQPDKDAKSFFSGAGTEKRLATGYQVVSLSLNNNNLQSSLRQLAEVSLSKHFKVTQ